MSQAIARPYAAAVFAVARERGDVAAWAAALRQMADAADALMTARAAGCPFLTEAQMLALIIAAVGKSLGDSQRKFLDVLAENGRLLLLPFVLRRFDVLRRADDGVVPVRVETAMKIPDRKSFDAMLAKWLGQKVETTYHDNPDLLGGVCVYANDNVLDASLRGRLMRMSRVLG